MERAIQSNKRVEKRKAQERANFDYILADLIGRSISRIYSSSAKMPEINEAYPALFDEAEINQKKQEKQQELYIARFKQFANSHNAKLKRGDKQ